MLETDYLQYVSLCIAADRGGRSTSLQDKLTRIIAAPSFDYAAFADWGRVIFEPEALLADRPFQNIAFCNLTLHDGTPLYRHIIAHADPAFTLRLWYRALYEKNLDTLDEISSEPTYFADAMQTETIVAGTFSELAKDRYDDTFRREVMALMTRFAHVTLGDIAVLRHGDVHVPQQPNVHFAGIVARSIACNTLADMMLTAFMPQLQATNFDDAWLAAIARAQDGNAQPLKALLASDFDHNLVLTNEDRQQAIFALPIPLAELVDRDGRSWRHHLLAAHPSADALSAFFANALQHNDTGTLAELITTPAFTDYYPQQQIQERVFTTLATTDCLRETVMFVLNQLHSRQYAPTLKTMTHSAQLDAADARHKDAIMRFMDMVWYEPIFTATPAGMQAEYWNDACATGNTAAVQRYARQPGLDTNIFYGHDCINRLLNLAALPLANCVDATGTPLYQRYMTDLPADNQFWHRLWRRALIEEDQDATTFISGTNTETNALQYLECVAQSDCSPAFARTATTALLENGFIPTASDIIQLLREHTETPHINTVRDTLFTTGRDAILAAGGPAEQRLFLREALRRHEDPVFLEALFASPHFKPLSTVTPGHCPLEFVISHAQTEAQALNIVTPLLAQHADSRLHHYRNSSGYNALHFAGQKEWQELTALLHNQESDLDDRHPDMAQLLTCLRERVATINQPHARNLVLVHAAPHMHAVDVVRAFVHKELESDVLEMEAAANYEDGMTGTRINELITSAIASPELRVVLLENLEHLAPNPARVGAEKRGEAEALGETLKGCLDGITGRDITHHLQHNVIVVATSQDPTNINPSVAARFTGDPVTLAPPSQTLRHQTLHHHLLHTPDHRVSFAQQRALARDMRTLSGADIVDVLSAARTHATGPITDAALRTALDTHLGRSMAHLPALAGMMSASRKTTHATHLSSEAGRFGRLTGYTAPVLSFFEQLKEFTHTGERLPATPFILLHGQSGTGKSSLALELLNQAPCFKVCLNAATLANKELAEATTDLRTIFEQAMQQRVDGHGAALIVIDEIDRIGERASMLSAVIQDLLDRARNTGVVVVATTNYRARLEPALRRRLAKKIKLGRPDANQRGAIIHNLFSRLTEITVDPAVLAPDAFAELLEATAGATPATLATIITTAAQSIAPTVGGQAPTLSIEHLSAVLPEFMEDQREDNAEFDAA